MYFSLGLTGYPLSYSLSPRLHTAALRACGLEGDYRLYPAQTPADLQELVTRLRNDELHGLNVTIPHKQAVIPFLDKLTPTARAIGAVNTIYKLEETLIGDNTDAPGFWADALKRLKVGTFEPKNALLLGAGGAARAVAYALAQRGWALVITARRPLQAKSLIADLKESLPHTTLHATRNAQHATRITQHASLLINTTPVGMAPRIDASPWPEGLPFPPKAAVYDLVYNPRETRLVREARAAGLPAVTGLGMLIEQAALAFQRWTGQEVNREVMWGAVG
jgi:shikimate dehydrogenase